MVINDKVIFVHCPRTSGTSIRRALLKGEDPNDPENLQSPGNLKPGLFWRNQKHAYASMIKENVPQEVWETRFKFSIVRNPWDRMVSLYGLFRKKHLGNKYKINKFILSIRDLPHLKNMAERKEFQEYALGLNFKDWINFCNVYGWNNCLYLGQETPLTRIPQCRWFDGLDKVFKFEDRKEIDDFLKSIGCPISVPENASDDRRDWREYYDQDSYTLVESYFREDIERFNYGE